MQREKKTTLDSIAIDFLASSFSVNLMFLLLCFDVTYYLNFLVHKFFSLLLMFNKMFFFILKLKKNCFELKLYCYCIFFSELI